MQEERPVDFVDRKIAEIRSALADFDAAEERRAQAMREVDELLHRALRIGSCGHHL